MSLPEAPWSSRHLGVYHATPDFLWVPLSELLHKVAGGDKGPVTGKSSGNRTRGKESDGEGRLIQGNTDRGNQTSSGGVGTRSYWNIRLGTIPRL